MYGVRCALPLTPRALPRCTTTALPRVHCPRAALPGWPAGWLARDPRIRGMAWDKIQISRNEGVGPKSRFRGMGRGTQNTEITGYQVSSTESAKSTLFNFLNNYDTVLLSSVISVTVKTTDEHLVGRRSPGGALLWFFGKRSDTQKTTRGLQKDTYY